jgi:hypothetical protein
MLPLNRHIYHSAKLNVPFIIGTLPLEKLRVPLVLNKYKQFMKPLYLYFVKLNKETFSKENVP